MIPMRSSRRVIRRSERVRFVGDIPVTERQSGPAYRRDGGWRRSTRLDLGDKSHQLSFGAKSFAVCVALGVTWICWNALQAHLPRVSSASIEHALKHAVTVTAEDNEGPENQRLAAVIQAIIAANPRMTIGVSMINNKTGTVLNVGNTDPFVAASTAKVLTAVVFLHQVERGSESLSETIDGYPARWQLQQMVNQSNNDSWSALEHQVGFANLSEYATQHGVGPYSASSNTLTSEHMAHLLSLLYTGKLLNQEHTQLLLSYMRDTNNDDMMPTAVPANATVYHKYGDLDGYLHDAGIINYADHSVSLAIFTSSPDASDYNGRVKVVQRITAAVTTNLAQR